MITKDIAINSKYREEFHHITNKNADKTPTRCRVNGKCKTWKTRPDEFQLPVKHGMYTCFYITQSNAHEWLTREQLDSMIKAQTPALRYARELNLL